MLSVGLIGTKFMGKAHSNAWRQAPRFFDLAAEIRMATICGRDRAATSRAASKLGWESSTTDWRTIITDPGIDIVDICRARGQSGPMRKAAGARWARSSANGRGRKTRARGQHGLP